MQMLTVRIPEWLHAALRQLAHEKKSSINQICVDIFYDAVVTAAVDEVIVQYESYRIVRSGNRYAIVWGDDFEDLIPSVEVISPALGVVWFNTREAAIAEASVLKEE